MFLHTCPFSLDTYIKIKMELSKPYKGKGKRKLKKLPFTVKGYILYYAFFWIVIISIYLAYNA